MNYHFSKRTVHNNQEGCCTLIIFLTVLLSYKYLHLMEESHEIKQIEMKLLAILNVTTSRTEVENQFAESA